MSRLTLSLAALSLALVATPVAAQSVYQWKDAKGVTHYSDSPPAGSEYTNRLIRQNGQPSSEATTSTDKPAVETSNCQIARNNLARLDSGIAVGIDRDGDGKPDSNLTPEERQAQTQLAQATIKAACSQTASASGKS